MPKYDKIEELLVELYQHRKLFTALFERRTISVSEEAVLELIDGSSEKLERLAAYGLLVRTPGQVGLDSQLLDFFGEYMEVDETVHVLYIQENLDEIKKLKTYYLKDRQERDLLKIKKHLRGITRIAALNVKTLRGNMEETYTTESNFELKREKLEDIRSQRDSLEGVIKAVERMLEDDLFFRTASDEELLQIVHRLKVMLHGSRHNLIEVQHQVITYLNHIEKRAAVVEKVLRLKMLKDKHYLQQQTDFHAMVQRNVALPLAKTEPLRSRLSIAELQEDEAMQELVLKVRAKLRNRTMLAMNRAGELPESVFTDEEQAESSINLFALKNIFLKRSGDLFSFVMEHPFSEPVDDARRIGVFCQLASRFTAEFHFSDDTTEYDGLEVALVFGKGESRL
ncbi:MAG: hypothetical protein V3V05_02530 [Pontiella sp.]